MNRLKLNTYSSSTKFSYYPFGLSMKVIGKEAAGGLQNKFKYNGKEEQSKEFSDGSGLELYDFHVRNYDPQIGRLGAVDPLAEKYPGWSPYAYCLNNPIIWTDPTGMTVEPGSQKEWDRQKQSVTAERDRLQSKIDGLNAKAAEKGWSAEKLAGKIDNMQERVSGLNGAISNLGVLENSTQVYSLNSGAAQNEVSYDASTGNIVISYSGTALFTHETTHAGQFETGDIAFNSTNGATLAQDVYDEMAGYKAQWAYNPSSVGGLQSASQITISWVQGVTDPTTGNQPYKPGGSANTGISPINVNSTRDDLIRAYPHQKSALQNLSASSTLRSLIPTIYTKK